MKTEFGLRLGRCIDYRDRPHRTLAARRRLEKGPQLRTRPAGIVGVDHNHRVAIDQVLLEIRPYVLGRAVAQRLRQYGPAADRSANLGRDLAMPRLGVEEDERPVAGGAGRWGWRRRRQRRRDRALEGL